MGSMILMIISAIFVNNVVFTKLLGICPYMGLSKNTDTAIGMGTAVTFVLTIAGAITYIVQNYVLVPAGIQYLQTIVFILVIASLVQFVEIVMKKTAPSLYKALETRQIPKIFAGSPLALIVAGILAMAFMGFSGMVK